MTISFTYNGQQMLVGLFIGLAVASYSSDDAERCAYYAALAFLSCFTIKRKPKP